MNAYGIIPLGTSPKGEMKMRPFGEQASPPPQLLSLLGIAFTLLAILGCASFKGFRCSQRKADHKCGTFGANEWVLKFPVSRAGLDRDARTHLHPPRSEPGLHLVTARK